MSTSDAASGSNQVIHRDIVCPFCAGACDDLQLTVEANRIVAALGGCAVGRQSFLSSGVDPTPQALIDGEATSLENAIATAAQLLSAARAPLIFGLERLTCEAQSLAVSLADRLGATIDSVSSRGASTRGTAAQQVGESTCTLGDLRDRADFVLFWEASGEICQLTNVAPGQSSNSPLAGSPATRTIVELRETNGGDDSGNVADRARRRFALPKDVAFEGVCVLRALVNGVALNAISVREQTGVPLDVWNWLAGQMKSAQYGVIIGAPRDKHVERALNELVIELNRQTRFVYLNACLEGMNGVGAEQVLTWRTGYPCAVNFAAGYPRFGPREYSTKEVLSCGEADAVLAFGFPTFSDEAIETACLSLPRVVLTNYIHEDDKWPTVFIRTAQPGLHSAGTIFRFDGVPLPLRVVVPSSLPAAEDVLTRLLAKING